jgi:hypothetical protein
MKLFNKSFRVEVISLVMVLGAQQAMAGTGPCDILASGGAPCVAAHSTTRALLAAYNGPLYQLRRASDGQTQDVGPLSAGDAADASIQDAFCAGTSCTISEIYDQSGKGNHLKRSQGGGEVCRHQDQEAVADALPLLLGGRKVYGIKVVSDDTANCMPRPGREGTGYRLDKTNGIAVGDDAETEYFLTSGDMAAHGNSGCCFDFGNVETDDKDDGGTTMEAVYFGGGAGWGRGGGNGPWVLADMENGVFSGPTSSYTGNTSVPYSYVTAALIGRSGGTYALLAGDAQKGELQTMYDGPRPDGYTVMHKQGAIGLGTGGDNSDHGKGYFFEGVMTTGAASIATMKDVHANIVAAGYGSSTPIVTVPAHRDSVFNGGFDLGTFGWTFNTWEGGAHGSVVGGEYKIQIDSIGQHNSGIQLVQNGIILEQGKSYEVTFDAYASAKRTLEANVEQDVSPWTSYLPALQSVDLTTTKTTFSYAFNMTNPTDSNGRVTFNAGASTEAVFLDNISIRAIPTGIRTSAGSLARGVRWSAGVLLVPGTASGKLQIIDAKGRSRIFNVTGGRASTGSLPTGIYQAKLLGEKVSATGTFLVLP